ncbi:NAD(P)-dependent oxidoreductase [Ensifer aridi]|uniref:NAD(P)-dependent oxidoreductase n=1 Tax=Ensifer aridi TaxID=1708715 RepID=UPI0009BD728B
MATVRCSDTVLLPRSPIDQIRDEQSLRLAPSPKDCHRSRLDAIIILLYYNSVLAGDASVFGEAELAAMKSSAFLINIARASLVREKPLNEALAVFRRANLALTQF